MTESNELIKVENAESGSWEDTMTNECCFAPTVNIFETNDEYILTADMPGLSKEDVRIKTEEGSLVIMGKVKYKELLNRKYILNESEIGNYYRKFNISDSIDDAKIEAKMENGQLTITLPKHERVKPKIIEIK
jgi:Molecular chaperone (small heat shock protein)